MSTCCIAFDLEGPLSPQDAAFEVMGQIPNGRHIFRAISLYDDILALAGQPDYEPGDTLALIVPFLVAHGIGESEIRQLAMAATLVDGAPETVAELTSRGYQVFAITSSYHQHALTITARLGIQHDRVACTAFPIEELKAQVDSAELAMVATIEKELLQIDLDSDQTTLRRVLDDFYWQRLPRTSLGKAISSIKPVGGRRKVAALQRFASATGLEISGWIAVGDSITDSAMLTAVREGGGLAVAFNANKYALEFATVGLASTSLKDILPLVTSWEEGGLERVRGFVSETAKDVDAPGPHYQWLLDRASVEKSLVIHARFRQLVREAAASLG